MVPPGPANAFPPSGNSTGPVTSTTIKVPPGLFKPTWNLTNAIPPSGDTTSTLPTLTTTKEHNPASPNVFSSGGTATNSTHRKGINVGSVSQNEGNSPAPPLCPEKGHIPLNCTMKPVLK